MKYIYVAKKVECINDGYGGDVRDIFAEYYTSFEKAYSALRGYINRPKKDVHDATRMWNRLREKEELLGEGASVGHGFADKNGLPDELWDDYIHYDFQISRIRVR